MEIQKWKKKKERALLEGNKDSLYFACKELAEIYFNSEQYDSALKEYKEMERISEESKSRLDVGRANRMIGEVYCEKGEFDKAISHQMKHLVISREEKDKVEEQRALATLGRTYFLKGESLPGRNGEQEADLTQAKNFYLESLAVCNQLSDGEVGHKQKMEMVARLFLNIGLVLDSQNQYQSAIDYMHKAISICKKLDLWEDLYRTYSAIGAAYHRHEDKNKAIKTYDLAIDIAQRLSNKVTMMCEVLLLKADVLVELPDFRGARQTLLKAYKLHPPSHSLQADVERKLRIVAAMCECEEKLLDLSPDSDESERKKLYEDIGDAAVELNNFKLALIYYHLMLDCVKKCGSEKKALIDSYISLAQTYKDDQQYNSALEYFKKELELEDTHSPEACKTLLNIAEVYQAMGMKEEMYTAYNEAKLGAGTNRKLMKAVLASLEAALLEDNKVAEAQEVRREMDDIGEGFLEDSSDEEEEEARTIGEHISIDDLTDEENIEEVQTKERAEGRSRRPRTANLEKRNEKGETPLHVAAINGNLALAEKLIQQGHRVDVHDHSGWSPLHEASNHGHAELVRLLLEHGAPVNDKGGPHCEGVTPLLDAACNGNLDIMQILLSHGASPLMRNNNGESVIDCLSGWRRRRYKEVGVDISGSTLAQYSSLYKSLSQALERAGQKLSTKFFNNESIGENHSVDRTTRNGSRVKDNSRSHAPSISHHWIEKKSSQDSTNAASEYENAMKALRFRNNRTEKCLEEEDSPKEARALVEEDESVGDDWLVDDLGDSRPNKKRRTGDFNHDLIGRRSRHLQPLSPPSYNNDDKCESEEEAGRGDSENWPEIDTEPDRADRVSAPSSPSSQRSGTSGSQKKQLTLKSTELAKRKSFDGERNRMSVTDAGSRVVMPNYTSPPQSSSYSCVKVRIESKVVMVPVPERREGLTIAWLAEQAAARYKSLEGVEPVLQLEMDGGLVVGSDPLSIVPVCPSTVLEGKVLSWKLVSLASLYQQACHTLNTKCDGEVAEAVEGCQASRELDVGDLHLPWSSVAPLLRALPHYHHLQALSLASNNISDTNIHEVAECILKLPLLKELDLSNINITDKGLEIFSEAVSKGRGLENLKTLKLDYNRLGECGRSLPSLLSAAPTLRHLSLQDVSLSPRFFYQPLRFTLGCIENLNVNYNEIGREGVRDLLGLLDPSTVQELRLAQCGPGVLQEVGFYLEHHAPPSLRALDLSYCPYSSSDIDQLHKGARLCPVLEEICLDGVEGASSGDAAKLLDLPIQRLDACGWVSPDLLPRQLLQKLVISTPSLPLSGGPSLPGPYGLYVSAK